MNTLYLYVPPEDYPVVKAAGASWDEASKRWFIPSDQVSPAWSRWLGEGEDGEEREFSVIIDAAFVAAAQVPCVACGELTEVIALYGERGMDLEWGSPITEFTMTGVWGMDEATRAQLAPWPSFRWVGGDSDEGCFGNCCEGCGAVLENYRLHSEPGDVFFGLSRAEPGAVRFTRLQGRLRVSGDVSFAII